MFLFRLSTLHLLYLFLLLMARALIFTAVHKGTAKIKKGNKSNLNQSEKWKEQYSR